MSITTTTATAPAPTPSVVPLPMKRCTKCGNILPLDKFYNNCATKDGKANSCKECDKKRTLARLTDQAAKRPKKYSPQPGIKATLSLADFKDAELFAELKRRNWTGELIHTQTVTI